MGNYRSVAGRVCWAVWSLLRAAQRRKGGREWDAGGDWHMFMVSGNWPGEEERQEFWLAETKGQNQEAAKIQGNFLSDSDRDQALYLRFLEHSIVILYTILGASQVPVKSSLASAGDIRQMGSTPGSERSPGGGHGNPLQYSCLENPMDRGAWRPLSPWDREESHTTERLSTHPNLWPWLQERGGSLHPHQVLRTEAACPPSGSWGQRVAASAALIQRCRVPCPHVMSNHSAFLLGSELKVDVLPIWKSVNIVLFSMENQ